MRCHICDKALSEAEILVSPSGHGYEPCSQCMEVILDAAYSEGFVRPDDEETIIDDDGEIDTLDPDTFRSTLDDGYGFQEDRSYE